MGFSIFDNSNHQIVGYGNDVESCVKMIHNNLIHCDKWNEKCNENPILMSHPSQNKYSVGYYLYYADGTVTLAHIHTRIENNVWRFTESINSKFIKSWELLQHAPDNEQFKAPILENDDEGKNENKNDSNMKNDGIAPSQSSQSTWTWWW